jgi:hypothetical protein
VFNVVRGCRVESIADEFPPWEGSEAAASAAAYAAVAARQTAQKAAVDVTTASWGGPEAAARANAAAAAAKITAEAAEAASTVLAEKVRARKALLAGQAPPPHAESCTDPAHHHGAAAESHAATEVTFRIASRQEWGAMTLSELARHVVDQEVSGQGTVIPTGGPPKAVCRVVAAGLARDSQALLIRARAGGGRGGYRWN